jgi:transcriptional regulator with XRE-family HTH domain
MADILPYQISIARHTKSVYRSDVTSPDPEAARIGGNIRAARERRGLSQRDVAAEMTARIHGDWQQPTVNKVEHGHRKLSLIEAAAIAAILDTTIDRLLWLRGEDAVVATTEEAIGRLRQAWQDMSDATLRLARARAAGERALADAKASKYNRARDTAAVLEEEIESQTPEAALTDGRARFEDGDG